MVDLVLVQADRGDKIDLYLVTRRDTPNQCVPVGAHVLGNGDYRRDVVAGVRIIRSQVGVVKVQLAHRNSVGKCRPFGTHPQVCFTAEHGGARAARTRRVRDGLLPGGRGRPASHGCGGHACVVDDPVDDHVHDVVAHLDGIGGHLRDGPGELPFPRQPLLAAVYTDAMVLHGRRSFLASVGAEAGVVVTEVFEAVVQMDVGCVHSKRAIAFGDRRRDERMFEG